MRRIEYFMVCAIIAATVVIHPCAHAEEGGGGHYVPGLTASFVDALPGKQGLAMADYFSYYDGDESVSKQLPFGGLATAGLTATAYSNTVVALYRLFVNISCCYNTSRQVRVSISSLAQILQQHPSPYCAERAFRDSRLRAWSKTSAGSI